MPDTYKRDMRAGLWVAILWPLFFAAVMLCDVLPYASAMLAATP